MATESCPPEAVPAFFGKTVTAQLTHNDMVSLAAGVVGAVQIKGLFSSDRCADFVVSLPTADLGSFDHMRYKVPTFHFGPIINHFRQFGQLTEEYWRQAAVAGRYWMECDDDLRRACLDHVEDAWQGRAQPATVGGHEVYWGMVRENSHGAPPHWDEVVREFPQNFFEDRPLIQLVFNLYLAMPAEGGETTIWSRRWRPQDEVHRAGSCWPTLPLCEDSLTIKAEPGDALLFDPRNYHAVRPGMEGPRYALAFYLGITSRGHLRVWS